MKISELLISLRDTFANDQTISNFCQNKYGKTQKVFLGVDHRNPPLQGDYPIIVIFSVDKAPREEGSGWSIKEASIGVGVINETSVTDGNKVTYPGMEEVQKLRELVEDAIFNAKIGVKVDVNVGTASEMIWPLFRSDTVIQIKFLDDMEE